MDAIKLEGKDNNSGKPRQEFADRLAELSDDAFARAARTVTDADHIQVIRRTKIG